jgi:signal transduction histidine kinase
MGVDRGGDRYRGPDRRAASIGPRSHDGSLLTSAAVLAGLATLQMLLARFLPVPSHLAGPLERIDTAAGALAIVAGVEMLLRWRLDGRAFAWWAGIAFIILGVPGVVGLTSENATLWLGAAAVAAVLLIAARRAPDVDAALSLPRALIALLAAITLAFAIGGALTVLHAPAWVVPVALTVVFFGTAVAFARSQRCEQWLVLAILGCAFGSALLVLVPAGSLSLADAAIMHMVTGAIAVVGAALGLQQSARTHRTVALEARRERDVVEARYAETLHEVRSTVVALEGGMRTLQPQSASPESPQQSLAAALVAELHRLRELVEPGSGGADAEFAVRAALEPLLTVSAAGGWPVSWSIPEDLRACGRAADVAQIVHSLLTNARRYAPGSPIEVQASTEDDYIVLRVDDHGPGVARGRRESIFERGDRAELDPHPDAKGLGLHIARRLARELGGELWVEPRPESGARFVLIVPAAGTHLRVDHLERPRRAS